MKSVMLVYLVCLFTALDTPQKITWEMLSDVRFTTRYIEEYEADFFYPEFGPTVKALEGKEVVIKGYMIPVAPEEELFVLSKNSYANCFFCGGGGPETIVELHFKPGRPRFKMDEIIQVKGIFTLNQDDVNYCNYILKEAEVY